MRKIIFLYAVNGNLSHSLHIYRDNYGNMEVGGEAGCGKTIPGIPCEGDEGEMQRSYDSQNVQHLIE